MRKHIVLTASGIDRPGVIEEFTKLLLHFDGNVEASRMSRLGGAFAMLMLVSAPDEKLEELRAALAELHYVKYDVHTRITDVKEPDTGPTFTPCGITVTGADHMGIIHQITRYLAEQGINVETMNTEVISAPMSGSPLFTMSAVVRVPAKLSVEDLREALEYIGEEVGVETATFAHVD
jgi:glycine cleavage system transcriptional repressor